MRVRDSLNNRENLMKIFNKVGCFICQNWKNELFSKLSHYARAKVYGLEKEQTCSKLRWLTKILLTVLPFGLCMLLLKISVPYDFCFSLFYPYFTVRTFAIIVFTAVCLYWSFRNKTKWSVCFGLGVCLLLFELPLVGLWNSGFTFRSIIGGLLPFNDASTYYNDSQKIIYGIDISSFSARRPLFAAYLASLTFVFRQNLFVVFLCLTGVCSFCCYLFSYEVKRRYGALAGMVGLLFLYIYYRRFIGTTLTEHLGVTLGVLSLCLFWCSITRGKKIILAYLGLLTLTMALCSRAGTFFILPTLALWVAYYFKSNKYLWWHILLFTAGIICLGFLLNQFVLWGLYRSTTVSFANFSQVLYGIVVGGKGWMQIHIDHPEAFKLVEPELSKQIYNYAFDAFLEDPTKILTACLGSWKHFFYYQQGGYSFLPKAFILSPIAWICSFAAFFFMYRNKSPFFAFFIAAFVGILLSVPFVPPRDSATMRTYAASIMFFVMLLPVCIGEIIFTAKSSYGNIDSKAKFKNEIFEKMIITITTAIIFLSTFFPVFIKKNNSEELFVNEKFNSENELCIRINPSFCLRLTQENRTAVPKINESHLKSSIRNITSQPSKLSRSINELTVGYSIVIAYDLINKIEVYAAIPNDFMPEQITEIKFTGYWEDSSREYGSLFYALSAEQLSD